MSKRADIEKLWRHEKYNVMMHSQKSYLDIREALKGDITYDDLQSKIDDAKAIVPTKGSIINTYDHMWGYFKKIATEEERNQYLQYKSQYQENEIQYQCLIKFIYKLAVKYNQKYLLESTILH
ncbi:YbgA family protein [Staphylococcus sp. EG-SA-13]|nr:YbgA family protein [Staphylococcus sp. EG-SA-13]